MVKACLAHMLEPYPVQPTHVVAGALSTPNGEVLVAQRAAGEPTRIDGNFQVANVNRMSRGRWPLNASFRRNCRSTWVRPIRLVHGTEKRGMSPM